MKSQITRQVAGLLALLFSSVGMAATVTVVPSTLTPTAGNPFTITLTADVGTTLAATMRVAYDDTKVTWVSGAMPAAGPFAPGAGGSYTKNTPYTSGSIFDISTGTDTGASPAVYDAVVLTFNAIASGAANIVIDDDGGGCCLWALNPTGDYIPVTYTQAAVTVQGGAVNEPNIVVTESSGTADDNAVDFGPVLVNTTSSPPLQITVSNDGNLPLTISSLSAIAAPFAIATEDCTTTSPLAATTGTCTIDLTYSPTVVGADPGGSLAINSDDPQTAVVTVTLAGTGAPNEPDIGASPASPIDFTTILVNTTTTTTVTVTNSGALPLNITQIGAVLMAPYSLLNDTCSNTAVTALGGTCTFDVQFAPTSVGGPFLDTVDIPSNDPDENPLNINLTGSAAAAVADITVSPLTVNFGEVDPEGAAVTQNVTVTNDGTANLTIGTVAAADLDGVVFSIASDSCSNAVLAPDDSCTIGVAFSPQAVETYSDTFAIPSDDPDENPVTVTLNGSGMPPPPPFTGLRESGGGSAFDAVSLLALSLFGFGMRRRKAG